MATSDNQGCDVEAPRCGDQQARQRLVLCLSVRIVDCAHTHINLLIWCDMYIYLPHNIARGGVGPSFLYPSAL